MKEKLESRVELRPSDWKSSILSNSQTKGCSLTLSYSKIIGLGTMVNHTTLGECWALWASGNEPADNSMRSSYRYTSAFRDY